MKKVMKRILAAGVAVAVAGGCGFGGWKVYEKYHSGVIPVYDLEYLSTTYWGDESETEGQVTTDQLQTVYLSETQTVQEIKVEEGQEVKQGDELFTYDSTLTDLDLQRKEVELQQKELEIADTQKELKVIRTYKAGVPIPDSTSEEMGGFSVDNGEIGGADFFGDSSGTMEEEEVPVWEGLELLSGEGTEENPYCYLWMDGFQFTDEFLAAAMQGQQEAYITFYLNGLTVDFPEEEPEIPDAPEVPTEPETPDEPDQPSKPETPDESDQPSKPETPENPEEPTEPDTPAEPETPDEPKEPTEPDTPSDQPEEPVEPEIPGEPEEKTDPEASGEGSGESATQTRATMPTAQLNLLTAVKEEETEEPDDAEQEEKVYCASWTMHCQHTSTGYRYVMISLNVGGLDRPASEPLPELIEEETDGSFDDWIDEGFDDGMEDGGVDGIVYTGAEIASMIQAKEQELKGLDIELRQLKLEQEKLEKELNNSAVYSELDGVVSLLNDPDDLEDGTPLIKISADGGYLVQGTISELDLDSVQIGQSVTIMDWYTGETYAGSITEISEYPTSNYSYWGEGNTNVSYYPFTVSVDETANLEENSYVDMTYTPDNDGSGQNIYLMKSFVRSEGGKSYIYLDNDGTLEKRYVTTGKDLWGYYVEITGGLEETETYLAFPYGQKVRENAPTEIGSIDSLYSY